MNKPLKSSARPFSLAATALAASLMLAACGGGEVVPPPDTTPPTLVITDNVSGATTSGAVIFSFTFSEDVGTSFTAEDVVVTGGTAGAFAKVSATAYTLSVTPATNAAGSITVSVAAGKFSDIALNVNTAAASAAQVYDTTTPPASGDTVLLNFDDLLPVSAVGLEGGEGSGVAVAPAGGGSANAYRVLRSGGQVYALAVLEKVVPFTTDRKTVSAMVYSPTAGIPIKIKLEAAGSDTGDVSANETVVVGWQILSWTFSSANPATVYNKIVLLPNLGTVDPAPGKAYYFDDFKLKAAAVVTPPASADTALLNFDDLLPISANGGEGGDGSAVAVGPAGGGSGNSYKVLRSGGQVYALAVLEKVVPFTADRKTLSAMVYSPTAGIPMPIKMEGAGGVNTGDVPANQVVVVGWQTLTWTFSTANPATVYNKIVLLPNLGTVDAAPGKSYYFDDFKLKAAAVVTPPATGATLLLNFDDLLPISAAGGEGGDASGLAVAPAGGSGSGNAYRVLRSGGQVYALAVLEKVVPLTVDRKSISALVHSPTAGIPMVIKLETATGANTGDVQANETVVAGWQTLTWTFASANPALTYNKIVLLPNLGTVDAAPGKSYYFDDVKLLAASTGGGTVSGLPITFDGAGVTYTFTGFEGAEASTLAADPAGGSNMVGKVVRAAGGPWYGGTTVSTGANKSIATLPFTASAKTMKMRVYSPGAGMRVRMKVENAGNPGVSCETDAVTVGTGWETLSFNFANPGLAPPVTGGPTTALNVAETYNKVTVFFNVAAAGSNWAGTYYFDDIAFGTP